MTSESDRLLRVRIFNIYPYSDTQQGTGPQNFLVFLKGDESKVVPITIGHFEGQALAMALRKIPLPRPLPHNLLQNLLEKMEATVHKLVIHTLKDDVFHAYLHIQTPHDTFYLDCRPSDGMIVATLTGTPLYMSPEVMTEAGRALEVERDEEGEERTTVHLVRSEEDEADACEPSEGAAETATACEQCEMTELEKLNAQLERLIAEEAYEEAARVRDQIRQLGED